MAGDMSARVVLVVDDHEYNRDVLSRWLKKQGFVILEAENGVQALEVLHNNSVDLILLDIMMPEMNGFQVLENLKENKELLNLPVIVISASDDIESVVRCIELGAEDYLFKPFNRVLLKARIRASLEKRLMRQQEESYREQIISMRKLADLGTMASGVAHELNSPLQVITGQSDSLLRMVEEGDNESENFQRKLETIKRNAWRCADIISSLRTYSQAPITRFVEQDLNSLIEQAVFETSAQIEDIALISIVKKLGENLPPIQCEGKHLVRVFVNLLLNAVDALLPEGGIITICSFYDEEESKFKIEIADDGVGIAQEVQDRIFDPFFTTKYVGEGIGLGLSTALGIVRAHAGKIIVNSTLGEGTIATILLPIDPQKVENEEHLSDGTGRFDNGVM